MGGVVRGAVVAALKNFDESMKVQNVMVVKASFRLPNRNAYVERSIQTIQQECTHHFVICGTRHFDCLLELFAKGKKPCEANT